MEYCEKNNRQRRGSYNNSILWGKYIQDYTERNKLLKKKE